MLMLLSASYVSIGHGVAGRLTRYVVPGIGRAAIAYVVGCSVVGLTAACLSVGGLGLSVWIVLGVAVAAAAQAARSWRPQALVRLLTVQPALTRSSALEFVIVSMICAFGVILVAAAAVSPLTAEDGWALWGLKAHALYSNGGVQSPVFTAAAYESTHQDYPLLFPAVEALGLRAIGRFDDALIDVPLALFSTCASLAVWSLLRLSSWRWLAAAVALALLALPGLARTTTWNLVDVPLALIVTLAAVLLARWLEERDRASLWGAALFLASAAMAKNEGLMFAIVLLVAAAIASTTRKDRLALVAICGLVLGLAVLPWRIWLASHGIHNSDFAFSRLFDFNFLETRSGRLGPAAVRLLHELVAPGSRSLLIAFAVSGFLAALATRERRISLFLALWSVGAFAALVAAYWISRWPLQSHLDTSADRVVTSIAFVGAALSTALITRAFASMREAQPQSHHV